MVSRSLRWLRLGLGLIDEATHCSAKLNVSDEMHCIGWIRSFEHSVVGGRREELLEGMDCGWILS